MRRGLKSQRKLLVLGLLLAQGVLAQLEPADDAAVKVQDALAAVSPALPEEELLPWIGTLLGSAGWELGGWSQAVQESAATPGLFALPWTAPAPYFVLEVSSPAGTASRRYYLFDNQQEDGWLAFGLWQLESGTLAQSSILRVAPIVGEPKLSAVPGAAPLTELPDSTGMGAPAGTQDLPPARTPTVSATRPSTAGQAGAGATAAGVPAPTEPQDFPGRQVGAMEPPPNPALPADPGGPAPGLPAGESPNAASPPGGPAPGQNAPSPGTGPTPGGSGPEQAPVEEPGGGPTVPGPGAPRAPSLPPAPAVPPSPTYLGPDPVGGGQAKPGDAGPGEEPARPPLAIPEPGILGLLGAGLALLLGCSRRVRRRLSGS